MDVIEDWSDFHVAMVGATAALAGLVIVAASVNIAKIITAAALTARLAGGIASLVLALSSSALGLIPGISPPTYGWAVIAFVVLSGIFQVDATVRIFQNRAPENRLRTAKAAVGFLPTMLYAVGGALLITGADGGLLVLAIGCISAIIIALMVSWIVLVEVLR